MKTIRIFVGSPGDVAEERHQVKTAIDAIQKRYHEHARIIPLFWEELALLSTSSFQEGMHERIYVDVRIDIAVFIIWSRLGMPLGPAAERWGMPPETTGTECEFELMSAAFRKSGGEYPRILTFRRTDQEGYEKMLIEAFHKGGEKEVYQQREKVEAFFENHFKHKEGFFGRAYKRYKNPVDFAQHLVTCLDQLVQDILGIEFPVVK
ncbi:MAG: hypothetical protein ACAI35_28135 [Candidatus Methylacidiphilales bacterium]